MINEKSYQWSYPLWFDTEQYNTVYKFIVAFIEKELSCKLDIYLLRFLYFKLKEIKEEKFAFPKKINEFFSNLENLTKFLSEEFTQNNQKDWTKVIYDNEKVL